MRKIRRICRILHKKANIAGILIIQRISAILFWGIVFFWGACFDHAFFGKEEEKTDVHHRRNYRTYVNDWEYETDFCGFCREDNFWVCPHFKRPKNELYTKLSTLSTEKNSEICGEVHFFLGEGGKIKMAENRRFSFLCS